MWCIYEVWSAGEGDYDSKFVEYAVSEIAGLDRIKELNKYNPTKTYYVQWVYHNANVLGYMFE